MLIKQFLSLFNVIVLVFGLIMWILMVENISVSTSNILTMIAVVLSLIYHLLKNNTHVFSRPSTFYIIALIFFHISHTLLVLFGFESRGILSTHPVSDRTLVFANLITAIGVFCFVLGANINFLNIPRKQNSNFIDLFLSKYITSNVFEMCINLALLIFLIAFALDFDPSWFRSSYGDYGSTSLIRLLWRFGLPCCSFLFLMRKDFKSVIKSFFTLIFVFFIMLMMGNRGYAISTAIAWLWVYMFSVRRIPAVVWAGIFAISMIVVVAFYQVKSLSLSEKLDFKSYSLDSKMILFALLYEGSTSYRTIVYTIDFLPSNRKYDFGASYLWALSTVLPNIGSGKHIAQSREDPSTWLAWQINPKQAVVGQAYGFSVIAEAFYNFSYIGVILIMFFLGYIFKKLETKNNEKSYISILVSAIVLQWSLWGVRNSAESIVRPIFWQIFIVYGIVLICNTLLVTVKTGLQRTQK